MSFPRLGGWYADPLSPEAAQFCAAEIERRLQQRWRRGRGAFAHRVALMVAHHWAGQPVEHEYQSLATLAQGRRARAAVDLIYGQLLMACRRPGAMTHLAQGESLAHPLLTAEDYFILTKRHRLLAVLPAVEGGSAEGLTNLLATAKVITRLTPNKRHGDHDPSDMIG